VIATVRSVHPLDQESVDAIAMALSERLNHPVTLEVIVLPVTRSRGQ
jgi:F0F1-type ATP synthase delta subunit